MDLTGQLIEITEATVNGKPSTWKGVRILIEPKMQVGKRHNIINGNRILTEITYKVDRIVRGEVNSFYLNYEYGTFNAKISKQNGIRQNVQTSVKFRVMQ